MVVERVAKAENDIDTSFGLMSRWQTLNFQPLPLVSCADFSPYYSSLSADITRLLVDTVHRATLCLVGIESNRPSLSHILSLSFQDKIVTIELTGYS